MNLPKPCNNFSSTLMFSETCKIKFEDRPICPICKKHRLYPLKIAIDHGIDEFYDANEKNHVIKKRVIIEQAVWLCELSCDMEKIVDKPVL